VAARQQDPHDGRPGHGVRRAPRHLACPGAMNLIVLSASPLSGFGPAAAPP
jgi:hypothetical protein